MATHTNNPLLFPVVRPGWWHSSQCYGSPLQLHVFYSPSASGVWARHTSSCWLWLWSSSLKVICPVFPRGPHAYLFWRLRHRCGHLPQGMQCVLFSGLSSAEIVVSRYDPSQKSLNQIDSVQLQQLHSSSKTRKDKNKREIYLGNASKHPPVLPVSIELIDGVMVGL